MSKLIQTKLIIKSSNLGGSSSLPDITQSFQPENESNVFLMDEEDGLFTWYGEYPGAFPYRSQDLYDRDTGEKAWDAVILENENLRAMFLPGLGGKLWSLIDLKTGKELLFRNDMIRPCNLALRNAWTSGGVEWNCGWRGHSPYTCEYVHTAQTKLNDGTPVLRFYWFERVRRAVVQMDCFLPDGAEFLYIRTRITNSNKDVVPMYWWSNIAVVQKPGDRVIVPAVKSYSTKGPDVVKFDIPEYRGRDVTYPLNNIISKDFFWTTFHNYRHYVAQLDTEGYGLCQTSTSRLQGRKLFVWGNSQGGDKWMNYLTADDKTGHYDEIQCGLAHSQYECLPMPPHTVWEWAEAYGALQADPAKVHGDWTDARGEVEARLEAKLAEQKLEDLLAETKPMAKAPAEKVLFRGDGWGALELLRREKAGITIGMMNPQLDFGGTDSDQEAWVSLLQNGTVGVHDPLEVPASYMEQPEWLNMLRKAVMSGKDKNNWYAFYLLGCAEIHLGHHGKAQHLLEKSLLLAESPWTCYALSVCAHKAGDTEAETGYLKRAFALVPSDISLAKEVLRSLFVNDKSEEAIAFFEKAPETVRENNRCKLYYAFALAKADRVSEAETILCGEDGKTYLLVPDIREGELTETELWFYIQEKKGLDRKTCGNPPKDLDFRMMAREEELD